MTAAIFCSGVGGANANFLGLGITSGGVTSASSLDGVNYNDYLINPAGGLAFLKFWRANNIWIGNDFQVSGNGQTAGNIGTHNPFPGSGQSGPSAVTFSGARIIFGGNIQLVPYISYNDNALGGGAWNPISLATQMPGESRVGAIAYDGTANLVCVGQSTTAIATSVNNGITWTPQQASPGTNNTGFACVKYGGGLWVAGGQSGASYFTSPDGLNWTQQNSSALDSSPAFLIYNPAQGIWTCISSGNPGSMYNTATPLLPNSWQKVTTIPDASQYPLIRMGTCYKGIYLFGANSNADIPTIFRTQNFINWQQFTPFNANNPGCVIASLGDVT